MSWTLNYQRGPNRQWRILGKSGGWGESEKIGKRLRWGDSVKIGKRWLREICSQLQVGCMLPLSYCSLHLWWFDLSWSLLHSTTCTLLERRNVTMDIRDTIWNSSCCHKFSVRLIRVSIETALLDMKVSLAPTHVIHLLEFWYPTLGIGTYLGRGVLAMWHLKLPLKMEETSPNPLFQALP